MAELNAMIKLEQFEQKKMEILNISFTRVGIQLTTSRNFLSNHTFITKKYYFLYWLGFPKSSHLVLGFQRCK